jgi:hypothetical protein
MEIPESECFDTRLPKEAVHVYRVSNDTRGIEYRTALQAGSHLLLASQTLQPRRSSFTYSSLVESRHVTVFITYNFVSSPAS